MLRHISLMVGAVTTSTVFTGRLAGCDVRIGSSAESERSNLLIVVLLIVVLLTVSLLAGAVGVAEAAVPPVRYLDEVFTDVTESPNTVYRSAPNDDGNPFDLKLDLYQPTGDVDPNRAALGYIHGGDLDRRVLIGDTRIVGAHVDVSRDRRSRRARCVGRTRLRQCGGRRKPVHHGQHHRRHAFAQSLPRARDLPPELAVLPR